MGKVLNKFYGQWANPGLLLAASQYNLEFNWVIEAGCHDGSDTLKFLELQNVEKVYAFEPDIVAAEKAELKFKVFGERVIFNRFALMDKRGYIQISSSTGNFGDGTTSIGEYFDDNQISKSEGTLIPCTTLDDELSNLNGRGLIWLDVEGSAAKVLQGSAKVLDRVDMIQVEVDLHNSLHRTSNFVEVNRILIGRKFAIIYGPIHPGFFGDAVYIKKSKLGLTERVRSQFLNFLMHATHRITYPLLRKPKP
jgi:FkbM family methyltransferase